MTLSDWLTRSLAVFTIIFAQASNGEPLWSNNSFTLLSGNHYQLTPDHSAEILTFEHASNYRQGDLFLFVDRFRYHAGAYSTYGEFSPRVSLKPSGFGDDSFIKGVFLAGTWEHGRSYGRAIFNNYLLGFGLDFTLPYTKYSKANVYYRDNDNSDDNWQLTLNFAVPWQINNHYFLYDGFLDWTSANSKMASSANFTTQLKWDIGRYWQEAEQFYIGIEYVYWRNKYGLSGIREHNSNLLFKFHF